MFINPASFFIHTFRRLSQTQETLTDHDRSRAARLLIVDGVCVMGMMTLQGGVFLPAFALLMGATNYEIGMLTTIALASQLMQLPGLALVSRFKLRRAIIVFSVAVSRLLWLPIICMPVLFAGHGVTFLLQWIILAAVTGALAGPAWNSLLRDVVPTESMGKVFSKRLSLGTALALVMTIGGGWFLDTWKARFPSNVGYGYSILFMLGLLLGMIALVAIAKMPEVAMKKTQRESWGVMLLTPLKDVNFRKLVLFISVWTFALNMAAPFFIIYMLERIQISMLMVTVLTVISQLVNLLFLGIWGRLADRFSNKSVLSICCPLFLTAILAWCFTTMPERYNLTIPILIGIQIVGGLTIAGISIGVTNIAFKLCPDGKAHSYMTVFGLMAAGAGAIAPLVGGVIADFFAQRNLSIPISWSGPSGEAAISVVNIKALDFLFLFTFIVGLFSLRWLKKLEEKGEVTNDVVINGLVREITIPLRTFASIEGMRRLTYMPVSMTLRLKRKMIRSVKNGKE